MIRGAYPGSFNPPTIGHIAIMRAALEHCELDQLDVVLSRRALGKDAVERPSLDERVDVLRASVAHLSVVDVVVTDLQLIADIAAGYDVVVMGADKWRQVNDVRFYDDEAHRDAAVAALPRLAIAGRGSDPVPTGSRLPIEGLDHISSSAARSGALGQMTPQARSFAERTGVWLS
jgi:cytidyltransferase-like protein